MIFLLFNVIFNSVFSQSYSFNYYVVISDTKTISEGSALLKSRKYDLFWTLNDSGDSARIFAINPRGEIIKPSWVKKYNGLKIYDAYNVDWEAMVSDDEGNIYIIDAGNNYNYRRDLTIYKLREPNPYLANEHGILAKYIFEYPDQKDFPDNDNLNFDCEAGFYFNNKLCLITKTRSSNVASFYCFDSLEIGKVNIPSKVYSFDFGSMVTDASISPDKKYLAVLTYNYIWLFDFSNISSVYEIDKSKKHKKEISLGQCEGISFYDNQTIFISNEEGYLFRINIHDIINPKNK